MTEIAITEILDIEQYENFLSISFNSRYDPRIFNEDFLKTNGKYVPYSFTFKIYSTHIINPEIPIDYFKTTETITLQDCIDKKYSPVEAMLGPDGIYRITDGQHRILRVLWLCLNNHIRINDLTINCIVKEYA